LFFFSTKKGEEIGKDNPMKGEKYILFLGMKRRLFILLLGFFNVDWFFVSCIKRIRTTYMMK